MKKLFVALMTVLFLGSTTAVVLADDAAPATTPVAKTMKAKKHAKKSKKSKKAAATASTTPTSK